MSNLTRLTKNNEDLEALKLDIENLPDYQNIEPLKNGDFEQFDTNVSNVFTAYKDGYYIIVRYNRYLYLYAIDSDTPIISNYDLGSDGGGWSDINTDILYVDDEDIVIAFGNAQRGYGQASDVIRYNFTTSTTSVIARNFDCRYGLLIVGNKLYGNGYSSSDTKCYTFNSNDFTLTSTTISDSGNFENFKRVSPNYAINIYR